MTLNLDQIQTNFVWLWFGSEECVNSRNLFCWLSKIVFTLLFPVSKNTEGDKC